LRIGLPMGCPSTKLDSIPDYTISPTGELTVDPDADIFPRPLVGQVRADGELFILADTRTDPPDTDNSVKTVFVGIKAHDGEEDLLAGTWDFGDLYSGYESGEPFTWDESSTTMVLDAAGEGTWSTTPTDPESGEGEVSIDLATDGSFSLPAWNTVGAVTASGDVMVMLRNDIRIRDGVSIGIKTP
ncbi:MAG: hypothetical protein ACLFPW_11205, partial [Spirochaetaceae bacterium]